MKQGWRVGGMELYDDGKVGLQEKKQRKGRKGKGGGGESEIL